MIRTFLAVSSAVVMLLVASSRADASSITIAGSTLGCFGIGCTNFGSSPSSGSPYALTFLGTSFTVVTDAAGDAVSTIGSFTRGNTNVGNPGPAPLEFNLQVTFTIPVGISGNPSSFTAVITGKSASPYDIVFPGTFKTFNYSNSAGSGSFEFLVNSLTVSNNSSANLTATIQNATFTANSQTPAAVPEPGSLVLLGTGLGAIALRLRRRKV